jgi:hypothetical protein
MVGLGRFELPTYGLGNRRSIHLSYSPINNLRTAGTILGLLNGELRFHLLKRFPSLIIRNHYVEFKRCLDIAVPQNRLN